MMDIALGGTSTRTRHARWLTELDSKSFVRKTHVKWIMSGELLPLTEEGREQLKGLNLDAYEFQTTFVELLKAQIAGQ